MSREETKRDLGFYLLDRKVSVIALKGLWGTGKTYLWDEIKGDVKSPSGKTHLYASLFGVPDIETLKLQLFQNSFGSHEDTARMAQAFANHVGGAVAGVLGKWVKGADKGAALLTGVGSLLQNTVIDLALKDRLVVLDDVERRGDSLKVGSVLGFIDDLKRKGCRVLVLLNEDPIASDNGTDWQTLKEKCIDREITLSVTPGEAAEIGLSEKAPYRTTVVAALERAGVTNIRVVQRIDRVVSSLFDDRQSLPDGVVDQLIPAVVMITALNFNAVPGGLPVREVIDDWREWVGGRGQSKAGKATLKGSISSMTTFNLTRDMEFIDLVHSHVTTGRRLTQEFERIFDAREEATRNSEVQKAALLYINAAVLDPAMENHEFVESAAKYAAAWARLSADVVSVIALDLETRGGGEIAREMTERWAENWQRSGAARESVYPVADGLHPRIRHALLERNAQLSLAPTLLSSILKVSSGGWYPADQVAINEATEREITETLRSLTAENFPLVVHFYASELKQPMAPQGGVPIFTKGAESFVQVVAKIIQENKERVRLIELLQKHFGEHLAGAQRVAPSST
jgi:hypothetical protein